MSPDFPAAVQQIHEAESSLREGCTRPEDLPSPESAAMLAGACLAMDRGEWILPGLRERAAGVLRGCSVQRLRDPYRGAQPYRIAPPGLSPAARMLQACGLSLSSQRHSLCLIGQAALSYGAFHEALNLASLRDLPVIFLLSERELSGAPIPEQLAGDPLSHARAYGIPARRINGLSARTVFNAVSKARAVSGPSFLSARLFPA